MFDYSNKLIHALEQLFIHNQQSIQQASQLFANAIIHDNMIQVLGTGHSHMIGLEGFIRAGGLGNINAILDSTVLTSDGALRGSKLEKLNGLAEILWQEQNIGVNDLIVVASNSGRNALPVEFALLAKDKGHKVIAITSIEQSSQYPSRHESGLKLMDIADIVLDNRVPSGDGLCEINNRVTGAFSSISGMALINTLCTEAQKLALEQGVEPLIFSSQNIDGFNNDDVYEHFKGRLKSM
ncbi:sugar isomerase domain-containing protein [Aliivibrio fischeri]|uniref:sugar isomerase domain-containing protein n=1 Tax=Aliivibrio fischeri TaxID=668 RepID=UPI00107EE1F7|nr:sugar isomerase domain-containing protein [Aliivibrio fischeri]TGA72109.1 sugar isomerase domain-containing protein [Aliivibrio fischeri]